MDLINGVVNGKGAKYSVLATSEDDYVLPSHRQKMGFMQACLECLDTFDRPENEITIRLINSTFHVGLLWACGIYYMFPSQRLNVGAVMGCVFLVLFFLSRAMRGERVRQEHARR